jgi:simple sugar transport system permease protein
VSTPYLFVSLGEVLTEKSGRVNLGLEGTLLMGAMTGFAVGSLTGSPWLGVLAAGATGAAFGLLHAAICNLSRVNDIAVGIALFLFGIGLAFYLGKPFIAPRAAMLPALQLGFFSDQPAVRAALEISPLLIIGILLAIFLHWAIANTRWGLLLRMAGESADAARALGRSVNAIRTLATMSGGFLAGIGGAFLSLYYPGNWNEGLSSGQGLMAIALVIFARWNPLRCLYASLLFGGASALGPALQTVGVTSGYYLFSAAPYVLTLALLIYTSSTRHALAGAPSELSISR